MKETANDRQREMFINMEKGIKYETLGKERIWRFSIDYITEYFNLKKKKK